MYDNNFVNHLAFEKFTRKKNSLLFYKWYYKTIKLEVSFFYNRINKLKSLKK